MDILKEKTLYIPFKRYHISLFSYSANNSQPLTNKNCKQKVRKDQIYSDRGDGDDFHTVHLPDSSAVELAYRSLHLKSGACSICTYPTQVR